MLTEVMRARQADACFPFLQASVWSFLSNTLAVALCLKELFGQRARGHWALLRLPLHEIWFQDLDSAM